MGIFNQSSSPLSTLMPQSSPYKLPDYSNAFKMNNQMQMNNLKFRTGLLTSNSSDPTIALNGKSMMNDAMNPNYQDTQLLQDTNNSTTGGANFNWDQGFNAVSQVGNQIGGKVGNIISSAGKLGSSIRMISQASKGIKDGLAGASKMKAGGIGATIGAASDLIGAFMPQKTEYEGDKGDITQTMDSVYDGISDAAMAFGPVGMLVGGIMKGGSLLGKGVNALGGGTDGMCVCTGTKVYTATGAIINIEDLQQEQGIIGWNQNTKEIVPQTIHNIIEPRQKECLEITLKSGHTLRCSIDHPILSDNSPKAKNKTINGKQIAIRPWQFRRADELKVGDFVGLANNIDYWGDKEISKAYLIGMLIGDGSYTEGSSCRIISADSETWNYLEDNNLGVINHCDDSRPEKYKTEVRTYRIIDGMDLMRSVGLVYQSGQNKTLPKNLGEWNRQSVCQLIAGLFDTDGSISVNVDKGQYSITLYQSNKPLLEEVKQQLHKLGIFSTIGERKATKYELGGKVINSKESFRLEVHDIASARKFYELIHLNISRKQNNLEQIFSMLASKTPQEHNDISGAKQSKIVSIEEIGIQTVYNLQADNDHTYLANGIITHNTTTDAILGSSFLSLTPLGLVNGFGGKKADTITKDNEAFAQVGSSYTGSESTVNDALTKSGKKYGLLSSGARKKANREIAEAKRQQSIISNISDDMQDRIAIRTSMSAINGNRRGFQMQGGYDQSAVRIGRRGMSIELLNKARSILKAQKRSKLDPMSAYKNLAPKDWESIPNTGKPSYQEWVKDVNPDFQSENYDLESAYNNLPYDEMQRWKWAANQPNYDFYLRYKDENGYYPFHLGSVAPIQGTEDYIFLKKGKEDTNPEIHWETDTYYNGENGLKDTHDLVYEKDRYYYRKKKSKQETPQHKNGGSIIELISETTISLVNPLDIPEFQNGGSINVIPDGALHARKHNMNLDGITEKGIPVVSEKDDGEIEQQAEIEKEEVIFRLEVTQKLEELEKKYYSEEASQKEKDEYALEAGKLITEELLHNTKDNAGLL